MSTVTGTSPNKPHFDTQLARLDKILTNLGATPAAFKTTVGQWLGSKPEVTAQNVKNFLDANPITFSKYEGLSPEDKFALIDEVTDIRDDAAAFGKDAKNTQARGEKRKTKITNMVKGDDDAQVQTLGKAITRNIDVKITLLEADKIQATKINFISQVILASKPAPKGAPGFFDGMMPSKTTIVSGLSILATVGAGAIARHFGYV